MADTIEEQTSFRLQQKPQNSQRIARHDQRVWRENLVLAQNVAE